MDLKPGQFYKPSGKFNPLVVLALPIFVVLCCLSALIYAYVDVYIPIAGYISIIFVGCYAFLTYLASFALLQWFKVRSKPVVILWGIFAATVAIYLDWGCFVQVLVNKEAESGRELALMDVLMNPEKLWIMVKTIGDIGWYSIKSANVSGGLLWTFWGIEALIVGAVNLFGPLLVLEEVFCEKCCKWTEDKDEAFTFDFGNEEVLVSQFEQTDLGFLDYAKYASVTASEFYSVKTSICPKCNELVVLTLSRTSVSYDKEGKEEKGTDVLVKNMCFSVEDFKKLAVRLKSLHPNPSVLGSVPPKESTSSPTAVEA